MQDLISAALVTDTELVIAPLYVSEFLGWLASHGHQIIFWEGMIRSPKGKYTVSPQYSMRLTSGDYGSESIPIGATRRAMDQAYSQYQAEYMGNGSELYFCIRLKEKTDLAYGKVARPMRVLSAVLGTLFILLPTSVLGIGVAQIGVSALSALLKDDLKFMIYFLVGAPLAGAVFLWTAIKGRGPGPLGDPNWSHKAIFRFGVKYPGGTRKWSLWK